MTWTKFEYTIKYILIVMTTKNVQSNNYVFEIV